MAVLGVQLDKKVDVFSSSGFKFHHVALDKTLLKPLAYMRPKIVKNNQAVALVGGVLGKVKKKFDFGKGKRKRKTQ